MRLRHALSCCVLIASATVIAESRNPADYPLRIHVFSHQQTTFYHSGVAEDSKGEARGNLFANGDVHGVDFTFDCSEKLNSSFGYETYPAKWKKPNKELIVLLPVFGKTGQYFTCNLKTDVKDYAYVVHDGKLGSAPPAQLKAWMVKYDYDPEHGKNVPVKAVSDAAPATASGNPASAQQ